MRAARSPPSAAACSTRRRKKLIGAGVRQRPPAVDRPETAMCRRADAPGSRSASDSFRCMQPDRRGSFPRRFPWCVIFKAGTSEKTFDAWLGGAARAGAASGCRRRIHPASRGSPGERSRERARRRSRTAARSSSCSTRARALFHLDEFAIAPDQLVPLLREHLPADVGPPVRNEAVVTLEPYRVLLVAVPATATCLKSAFSGGIWIGWRKRRRGAMMRRSRC